MKLDKIQQMMTEELEDTVDPVHKYTLLQKYGIVEPKLTRAEQKLIKLEQSGRPCGRERNW